MSKYIIDVNDENPFNYYLYKLDGPLIQRRYCMYFRPDKRPVEFRRCALLGKFLVDGNGFCSWAEWAKPKEGEE